MNNASKPIDSLGKDSMVKQLMLPLQSYFKDGLKIIKKKVYNEKPTVYLMYAWPDRNGDQKIYSREEKVQPFLKMLKKYLK